jgi:hypothetical protein
MLLRRKHDTKVIRKLIYDEDVRIEKEKLNVATRVCEDHDVNVHDVNMSSVI